MTFSNFFLIIEIKDIFITYGPMIKLKDFSGNKDHVGTLNTIADNVLTMQESRDEQSWYCLSYPIILRFLHQKG